MVVISITGDKVRFITAFILAITLITSSCYLGELMDNIEPAIVFHNNVCGYWMGFTFYPVPIEVECHVGAPITWGYYYWHYKDRGYGTGKLGHDNW